MSEINLQIFKIDEYKEKISIYKNFTEKINGLKKLKESLQPSFLSAYGISLLIIFLTFTFFTGDLKADFLGIIYMSGFIAFLLHNFFYTDFFVNIISFGKLSELKKQIKKIEELRNNSYKKLQPLEKRIRNYFENQIEEFFESNLYKKRSGNQQFEEYLSEFSSMIDEAKNVDFATTRLYLGKYEDYLLKRTTDHNFQTSKNIEKLNSVSILARSFYKTPIKKPKEFIAPEKLYRTARKIDNWDEINKKRKMTGLKGEEIAVVIEKEFFDSIGRNDLAQKVRHVSDEDGDGLGYDVLSFFENGTAKYIEVKSTTISISSPFFISRNELAFLKEHTKDAFIYRVFITTNDPQVEIHSSQEFLKKNDLIPVQYIVKGK